MVTASSCLLVILFVSKAIYSIYNIWYIIYTKYSIYCDNPIGIKYIMRIQLVVSHLREHKFKNGFQVSVNPICRCGNDAESGIRNLYNK